MCGVRSQRLITLTDLPCAMPVGQRNRPASCNRQQPPITEARTRIGHWYL